MEGKIYRGGGWRKEGKEELTGICGAADFTLDFEMGGRDSFEEIVTCGAET